MKTNQSKWKTFFSQPRFIFNSVILFIFSAFWIRDFIYWIPRDMFGTSLNYWAFTDWLIDYSQGFIRRGLSGVVWNLFPTTIPRIELVAVFSWIMILLVVFGYIRLLARSWKTLHPLVLFGLLFLPSLFVFYLHDHNGIARKEILGYFVVLLHLFIVEKTFPLGDGTKRSEGRWSRYVKWVIPIALILLPATILVHEANFLMFVPLHAMITLTVFQSKGQRNFFKVALWTGLLYLPAIAAFGAVYLSGTPSHEMLLALCEKWKAAGALRDSSCHLPPEQLSGSTLPASLIPMEWSVTKAGSITRMIISMNWKSWIIILPTLGISIWYFVRQAVYSILHSRSSKSFSPKASLRYTGLFFVKFFVFPLLLSLPVYLTAYDYGRWFTITCINFSMVAVSLNLPWLDFLNSKKPTDEECAITESSAHLDHRLVFYGVSIILCVLILVLWLPHYCAFSCEIIRSPLLFFSHTFNVH